MNMYACITNRDFRTQDMMFLMNMLLCINAVLMLDDDGDDDVLQTEPTLINLNQQLLHFTLVLTYWQCTLICLLSWTCPSIRLYNSEIYIQI